MSPFAWEKPVGALYDWRSPDLYLDVARMCERAKMDFALFSDSLCVPTTYGSSTDFYVKRGFNISHDPVPAMAMMAATTRHLGLCSTLATTGYPPEELARLLGTMGELSSGRVGWNIVTGALGDAARNFGLDGLPEHDTRYDRADEYFTAVDTVWRNWRPQAQRGQARELNGAERPVIIVAGTSPRGRRYAAEHAELAISHQNTVDGMRRYVAQMHEELDRIGRDRRSLKIFFAIKPVMGPTEAIAQEKKQLQRSTIDMETGLAYLSATLGYDLSTFALDEPFPLDLPIQAVRSRIDRIKSMGENITLRALAMHEAARETYEISGSYEQVADHVAWLLAETGADGFHFRSVMQDYPYLTEVATHLMPILQDKGVARREYAGTTLRENLFDDLLC